MAVLNNLYAVIPMMCVFSTELMHYPTSLELSEYAQALTKEAKERYVEMLQNVGCTMDPYLDSYTRIKHLCYVYQW